MQKIKVKFNVNKCIGNGICAELAPKIFSFPDSKAELLGEVTKEGAYEVLQTSDEHKQTIIDAAKACPVNAIRVECENKVLFDDTIDETKEQTITAEYDDLKEFVMDPKGYFLIRVNKEESCIEVAHCYDINKIDFIIKGKKPIEIYQTIIKKKLTDRQDHAAYLGRELQKAYIALSKNIEYVQDDELNL